MNSWTKITVIFSLVSATQSFSLMGNRVKECFDENWTFSLGHATSPELDYGHNTSYFSYFAKTGYGDGPASPFFDDRGWRVLDVPHDWAVELPFDENASLSHGFKALGPGFPESSVGWYRKRFHIKESDLGKNIAVEFDGIFRDADIFINGFFVGNEPSGYLGQQYDLSDYLNYGGENVIVVRADASMEEGWFYEGAGIYRHVWLVKTEPVYFVKDGLWVNPVVKGNGALINIQSEIMNKMPDGQQCIILHQVLDDEGKVLQSFRSDELSLQAGQIHHHRCVIALEDPTLWDLETPYLYTLKSTIIGKDDHDIDHRVSSFGVRDIVWDPNRGFFLNGKHVKLKGTNNHQDHAGVGAAIPDSLQIWRLEQLKKMGSNTYRTSHNPPTPELLDACDRLGILVVNETRLMGINPYHFTQLERLVRRDRNHPSVILWGLGNEEWAIEGNIKGARITKTMQDFCHRLDPTRYTTVAISGGWGGVSQTVQCAGVNYIGQADPDQQHKDYPEQIILGTEETTTQQTRGIYFRDDTRCFLPPLENGSTKGNAESGWKFYFEREYTAGVIYWTGFDYRGEPTPYGWPATGSQFGILDSCGFPKDGFYYLKSWWSEEPVMHVFPHWNWEGKEGESIEVRLHSNCQTAELFLNGESQGNKTMELNGHLAWEVIYEPGELLVKATWPDGTMRTRQVKTAGRAKMVTLQPSRLEMPAQKGEVSVITVAIEDSSGTVIPDSEALVTFDISGPGRIIGVGNGNPSSLEPDKYVETVKTEHIGSWEVPNPADTETPIIYQATFNAPDFGENNEIVLFTNLIGLNQTITLNGTSIEWDNAKEILLAPGLLKAEGNKIEIRATPYKSWPEREGLFKLYPAYFRIKTPSGQWKRHVFNGLAQVIVESEGEPGMISLKASSHQLQGATISLVAN